jgi:hypothetical protein
MPKTRDLRSRGGKSHAGTAQIGGVLFPLTLGANWSLLFNDK